MTNPTITIHAKLAIPLALLGCLPAMPAAALLPAVYTFSTGSPDGLMATASRPDSEGAFEIETGDDFVLTKTTSLNSAKFTGLLTGDGSVSNVRVEIYRVFPLDSSEPPSGHVPTRANSPSDNALTERDSSAGGLSFVTSLVNPSFSVANSVQQRGINPSPGEFTGGNGALTGEEMEFDLSFTHGLLLPANHYFFVPQVEVSDGGNFFWLSAAKPIDASGTPFPLDFTDLQSWTRDEMLDPDWLRVGTDITHQGPFNASFSLSGTVVPEPSTWAMMVLGFAGLGFAAYRKSRSGTATP